jgi:hypothetical protein
MMSLQSRAPVGHPIHAETDKPSILVAGRCARSSGKTDRTGREDHSMV